MYDIVESTQISNNDDKNQYVPDKNKDYHTSTVDLRHYRNNSILFDRNKFPEHQYVVQHDIQYADQLQPQLSRPLSLVQQPDDNTPIDMAKQAVERYLHHTMNESTNRYDTVQSYDDTDKPYNNEFDSPATDEHHLTPSHSINENNNSSNESTRPYTFDSYSAPQSRSHTTQQRLQQLARPRTTTRSTVQHINHTIPLNTQSINSVTNVLMNKSQHSHKHNSSHTRPHTTALKLRSAYDSRYATSHMPQVFDKYQYWLRHSQQLQDIARQKRSTAKTLVELEHHVRQLKSQQLSHSSSNNTPPPIKSVLHNTTDIIQHFHRCMTIPQSQSIDIKSQNIRPLPRVAALTHRLHRPRSPPPIKPQFDRSLILPASPRVQQLAQPHQHKQTQHSNDCNYSELLSVVKPIDQSSRLLSPARDHHKFNQIVEQYYDAQLHQWCASDDDTYRMNKYPPAIRRQMFGRQRKYTESDDNMVASDINNTQKHQLDNNTLNISVIPNTPQKYDINANVSGVSKPCTPPVKQSLDDILSAIKSRKSMKLNIAVLMLQYEQSLNDIADQLTKSIIRSAYVSIAAGVELRDSYGVEC